MCQHDAGDLMVEEEVGVKKLILLEGYRIVTRLSILSW